MLMRNDRNVMANLKPGEHKGRSFFFQSVTQATKKKNFEYFRKAPTLDLDVTISDAIPVSYTKHMGAKATKQGSSGKHPAH